MSTLQDLNLNNLLYRQSSAPDDVLVQSENYSIYETPTESIVSGELDGNVSLVGGFLQSKNFIAGSTGWRIDADGNLEANSGTFRGTLNAVTITAANFGGYTQIVSVGDDIQIAVDSVSDAGGGEVFLKDGAHTPGDNDIIVPSNVYIVGQNSLSTIVDFENNARGFIFLGSDAYSTGTATATNGSTTVTGGSTVWTSAMVGRSILLGGVWYPIAARVSDTEITLAAPYGGENLSAVPYNIANPVKDCHITNLTITRSLSYAIYAQYVDYFVMDNVTVNSSAVAFNVSDSSRVHFKTAQGFANGYGFIINNIHYTSVYDSGHVITTTGDGWNMTSCSTVDINGNFFQSSTGNGISITSCNDIALTNTNIITNGGKGIELVSGNTNIIISACGARSNGSDGIKLTATSDNCIIANSILTTNGGYGINIAASSCDNNMIRINQYISNTSGDYSDSGTNTKTDSQLNAFGGTGADGALTISSGTTDIDCGGAAILIKNYSSISITGTGKLTFSNPHAYGTIVLLKSLGGVTLTSSTTPNIDVSGMGGAGTSQTIGAGLINGDAGTMAKGLFFSFGGGGGGQNNTTAGTAGTIASLIRMDSITLNKYPSTIVGGGGAAGGGNANFAVDITTVGDGGNGGGALVIECAGYLNFTGTIYAKGNNGATAVSSSSSSYSGGGGGGGGGSVTIIYNYLTASSGTITVTGGTGGNSDNAGSGQNRTGGGGGASSVAGSAGSKSATGGAKTGGDGAVGLSLVTLNTEF